jgi:uncharacterized protein (UPF0210 family)
MKIRTITTGIHLSSINDFDKIRAAAEFNKEAKALFTDAGYEVQTTRITTNSWEEYSSGMSKADIIHAIEEIDKTCKNLHVDFFNIGYTSKPENTTIIPEFNKTTATISCSAKIGDVTNGINFENVKMAAEVIKRISEETENGYGNFRFCAWSNCKSGIPFFPASYHEGTETTFAIGLECGDLAFKAFEKSNNFLEAEQNLRDIFESELKKIEKIAIQISKKNHIGYTGIDSSLAPSLNPDESIAFAFEKLGIGKFGNHGTLTISAIITKVLKSLSLTTCGYSGLMLPVCEDYGLATRANEQAYNITNLLLYSAVCGCGLDTLPIPGDTPVNKIEALLLDIASISIKLDKPLSARLLPAPGKKAGEMTSFNSPYLMDCKILNVK